MSILSTMTNNLCPDCDNAAKKKFHGGYSFTCFKCRERLLLDEPCKMMREMLSITLRKWGEVPQWKVEPNCGCAKACKRRQYQKG
jgi:tRNA(Ile2) C34 agmatinyltransferase TiaS